MEKHQDNKINKQLKLESKFSFLEEKHNRNFRK